MKAIFLINGRFAYHGKTVDFQQGKMVTIDDTPFTVTSRRRMTAREKPQKDSAAWYEVRLKRA